MDFKLNWKTQIAKLACKLSRNAGILYTLKGLEPSIALKLVYNSYVYIVLSHVNYCSNIWGLGSKNQLILFVLPKKEQ